MNSNILAAIEGILYVTGDDGLTIKQIAFIFDITEEEASNYLTLLQENYDKEERGITLLNTANIYKIVTKSQYIEYYKKLYSDLNKTKLSNASMEVLAIIAYRQPITRAEIEDIRGTNSDNIIRRLLAMSLIKEIGRLETPGRPLIYGTTKDFLDYFKLVSLEELPELIDNISSDDNERDLFNVPNIVELN